MRNYNSLLNCLARKDSELPLNRKEKFYTATVLPQIFFHKGTTNLINFLKATIDPLPKEIIECITSDDFLFYTEYNAKQSCGLLNIGRQINIKTNETPDLVIQTTKKQKYFIFIEAKMFSKTRQKEFDRQMHTQLENFIRPLCIDFEASYYHIALVPQAYNYTKSPQYILANWDDFFNTDIYDLSENYFSNYLKIALENHAKLSSVTFRKSLIISGKARLSSILQQYKTSGKPLYIGRKGGEKQIIADSLEINHAKRRYYYKQESLTSEGSDTWVRTDKLIKLIEMQNNK